MFFEVNIPPVAENDKKSAALVVLDHAESLRLLARAVAACAPVRKAWRDGMIIIGRGVTTAYVTEELLGIKVEPKVAQTVGVVCNGITTVNTSPPPATSHVLRKGQPVEGADSNVEILNFRPGDVFIKGANTLDVSGTPGVYVASMKGGTVGMSWPVLTSRGCDMIMPVSLGKLVASVPEAARHTGIFHFKYSTGLPVTLVPWPTAKVITEIQALAILCGVQAYHIGSGGMGSSQGSVHLSIEGEESRVEQAFELIKSIKGEPPASLSGTYLINDPADFNYDALAQLDTMHGH